MEPLLLPLHLTLLVIGAVATLVACVLAWPHRTAPGGICLLMLLLAIAEWQVGNAAGTAALTRADKFWWAQAQYVGVVAVPVLWLFFVLRYLGDPRGNDARWMVAGAVIPVATLLAAVTSAHHALLWLRIELVPVPGGVRATFHHGPLFWVAAGYSYLLLLLATYLLLRAHQRATEPALVAQKRLLIVAGMVPWVANLTYLLGVGVGSYLDPTPIAFGITGLCASFAVADFGLLELSPARIWRSR